MGHATTMKASMPRPRLFTWLGIVVGVLMPVLSALIYPVYMHQMQPSWAEWTRLMELQFVFCELAIIHVAIHAGYRDGLIWEKLPTDVLIALSLLFIGLIVSSAFVSKNAAVSVSFSIITVIHLRFGAAVYFLVRSEREGSVRSILPLLALGLVLLTILTIWKFQLPPPEWTIPGGKIEWASALPGFISVRHFGSWTGAIAAGLMIALLYGKREQPVTSLFYLLAVGMTFWSGTRAAVLAMAIVALIALVSLRRLPSTPAMLHVGGLGALAMLRGGSANLDRLLSGVSA